MLERGDFARLIYDASFKSGEFTLRSGEISHEYWDKYKLFQPDFLPAICNELSNIIPDSTQVLAGAELGGAMLTTALSYRTGIPAAYLRKEKKRYGTRNIREGADIQSKDVCIVEDIVTTGVTIVETADKLRKLDANVDSAICVILRDPLAIENIESAGIKLQYLFTAEELKQFHAAI